MGHILKEKTEVSWHNYEVVDSWLILEVALITYMSGWQSFIEVVMGREKWILGLICSGALLAKLARVVEEQSR